MASKCWKLQHRDNIKTLRGAEIIKRKSMVQASPGESTMRKLASRDRSSKRSRGPKEVRGDAPKGLIARKANTNKAFLSVSAKDEIQLWL